MIFFRCGMVIVKARQEDSDANNFVCILEKDKINRRKCVILTV